MALLDPDLALARILECVLPLPPENIPTQDSLGRYLSRDVLAKRSQPFADNSAMDGYALRVADLVGASKENPIPLKRVGRIRAGDAPDVLAEPGEVVRIFTGALVPKWADAVVMQEQARVDSESDSRVLFLASARNGQNIRRAGEEYQPGDCLLAAGSRVREAGIGLLCGDGVTRVDVYGRPRVAVIGTGNELVAPEDADLSPQSVVDGNSPMLVAASRALGAEVVMMDRVGDEVDRVAGSLRRAIESAHVVLTTGGASVGEFDVIPEAWEAAGVETVFWKVAIKPGKPLRFGVFRRENGPDTLLFALPGNPLSALTNFELFVHPVLRGLSGGAMTRNARLNLPLASDTRGARDRTWLVRAGMSADGEPRVEVPSRQGSNMLREAARNSLVAQFVAGSPQLKEGSLVSAFVQSRDLEGMSLEPHLSPPPSLHFEGDAGSVEGVIRALLGMFSPDIRVGVIALGIEGESLAASSLPGVGLFKIRDHGDSSGNQRAALRALKAFSGEADLVFCCGSGLSGSFTVLLESGDSESMAALDHSEGRKGWRLVQPSREAGLADSSLLIKLSKEIESLLEKES